MDEETRMKAVRRLQEAACRIDNCLWLLLPPKFMRRVQTIKNKTVDLMEDIRDTPAKD